MTAASDAQNNRPIIAAAFLLGGICSVASMDALAKILSASVPIMQINWARFFFHLLSVTPLVWYLRRQVSLTTLLQAQRQHLPLHIMRGMLLAASSFSFFYAISENPVPDALAIFFIEPLVVMLIARLFIGEKFDARLLVAAIGGLFGVLIILRPGLDVSGYSPKILFALVAAVCFAGYIVSARHVSNHTPAVFTSWTTALFGLIPISLLMFFFWQPASSKEWLLLIAVGGLSGLGHTLIILAVRYTTASRLAVLHYAEVPIAALISWFLFSHFPDIWVWSGIILIAMANLYALRLRH
ncbi:MAG: DMT family transporter [Proteobacteria bacterium]|nr:DMT family transporter [Pseudomonadota bacterium]